MFELPPLISQLAPFPRVLMYSSVGDRGDAVKSWLKGYLELGGHFQRAVAYYGRDRRSEWASYLRMNSNFNIDTIGDKFHNLAELYLDQPDLVDEVDYVLVADDDLELPPANIRRLVAIAQRFKLPLCGPGHLGQNSWKHMRLRGFGPRSQEYAGGVQLTNFVENGCLLMEVGLFRRFMEEFVPLRKRLFSWGVDWLMTNVCYDEQRPWGVCHNVGVYNPSTRQPVKGMPDREIDLLALASDRERKWLEVRKEKGYPLHKPEHVKTWLPAPLFYVINLERAEERRLTFKLEWEALGFRPTFYRGYDRRDYERGKFPLEYRSERAIAKSGRDLSPGEIGCATSHALLMRDVMEYVGPEGVILAEDDAQPIPGAYKFHQRIEEARQAFPEAAVILCHKAFNEFQETKRAGGAIQLKRPPWGSCLTWYSPEGLRLAQPLMAALDAPADVVYHELAKTGKVLMLDPPVAVDDQSNSYIENDKRRTKRKYLP